MKTTIQKFVLAGVLVGSLLSLSGCVLFFGPVGLVLDFFCVASPNCAREATWVGFVLDQKNPGRADALNSMPADANLARELGVTLSDLEQYNEELGRVYAVNAQLESVMSKALTGKMTAQEMDQVAQNYCFDNAQQVEALVNNKKYDAQALSKFASCKSVGLSEQSAKIFIETRFGVRNI